MARIRISRERSTSFRRSGVAHAEVISGKEMSFNNYVDADAAWPLLVILMISPAR